MTFEYTEMISICEDFLEEMAERVKNGEAFENVYQDIITDWDDDDGYYKIKEDVKDEILWRVQRTKELEVW